MPKKKVSKEKKDSEITKSQYSVPIKWNLPDTVRSVYANNILVQLMENEFKISFFETRPPIRLQDTDPLATEVQADCVASVIMHPKKVVALINALGQQYEIFKKREAQQSSATDPTELEQPS